MAELRTNAILVLNRYLSNEEPTPELAHQAQVALAILEITKED